MNYSVCYQSPLGKLLVISNDQAITGLWMDSQRYDGPELQKIPQDMAAKELPVLRLAVEWLDRYFAGDRPKTEDLPLAPEGSAFRQIVWRLLCQIPYGELVTYGEIARRTAAIMNRPSMSAQAVGGAIGHNPIGIIIPCHRVIGSDGSLTGYAGGLDKKRWLLEHEGHRFSP